MHDGLGRQRGTTPGADTPVPGSLSAARVRAWGSSSRALLTAAAVCLALTLWAPLWATRMEAPQYHGDETLEVRVYAGRVAGDVHEIETLNQYVGVHLPLDTAELHAAPWVLGTLLVLVLAALALPEGARRRAAVLLLLLLVLVAIAGAADLQYRLWQMGHVRDKPIFEGVPDFTPPILGSRKIANFTVHMGLRAGGWAYVAAMLLLAAAARRRRRGAAARDSEPIEPARSGAAAAGSAGVWLGALAGVALLCALFVGGLILIPRYQAAHPFSELQRSDADRVRLDDMFLDVTLVTPEFRRSRNLDRYLGGRDPDSVIPVLVGLNTHTGDIGRLHRLPGRLEMVGPDGHRYPSLTEPIVLSQHHNAYMLLFPARGQDGSALLQTPGTLAVEARGMGAVPVRRFEWSLPLALQAARRTWASRLMLVVALLAALLVVLSPCALELTLYYAAIISCTVTDATAARTPRRAAAGAEAARRRVLVNLGAFVAGFTLLYALSGATVGLIGAGIRQPLGPYSELLQAAGGLIILLFAARVAGVPQALLRRWRGLRPSGTTTRAGAAGGARATAAAALQQGHAVGGTGVTSLRRRGPLALLSRLRARAQARARRQGMRPRDSFLVGMGLSTACLSCMGGAVLYPLLVYAGITSWQSGLITLGLYSLFIAVPMVFIALGFFRLQLSLGRRVELNRALRYASAFMLAGIGLLILSGNERLFGDLVFRLLANVASGGAGAAT